VFRKPEAALREMLPAAMAERAWADDAPLRDRFAKIRV